MISSVIKDYRHNAADHTLTIKFVSGRQYMYKDVPLIVLDELNKAESKGEYLINHIKPNYSCEKLAR